MTIVELITTDPKSNFTDLIVTDEPLYRTQLVPILENFLITTDFNTAIAAVISVAGAIPITGTTGGHPYTGTLVFDGVTSGQSSAISSNNTDFYIGRGASSDLATSISGGIIKFTATSTILKSYDTTNTTSITTSTTGIIATSNYASWAGITYGTLPISMSNSSLIYRSYGDTRYLQVTGGTQTGLIKWAGTSDTTLAGSDTNGFNIGFGNNPTNLAAGTQYAYSGYSATQAVLKYYDSGSAVGTSATLNSSGYLINSYAAGESSNILVGTHSINLESSDGSYDDQIFITSGQILIKSAQAGGYFSRATVKPDTIIFYSNYSGFAGAVYAADYSANYGVRSLPDLGYIQNNFAPISGSTSYVSISGSTMTGALILNGNPIVALGAATKQYVDAAINGLQIKQTATVATVTALPTNIYNNGTSGVGATLIGVATGVLTIDSYVVALGDYVLVTNEVSLANNGLYQCTTAGAVGIAYVLTRAVDMNTPSEFSGAFVPVSYQGTINKNSLWLCNPVGAVTIGTTPIPFTQVNGATDLIAGSGINISGNTISTLLSLTTTGSSGSATYSSNVLNIPTYTLTGLGGQAALSGTGFVKISGTTISYDTSTYNSGAGTSNQMTFYSGTNTLTSNSNFQVSNSTNDVTFTISAGVTGSNHNLNPTIGDPSHIFDVVNNGSNQFTLRYCTFGTVGGQNDVHYVRTRGNATSPTNVFSGDYMMSTGFRSAYGTGSNGTFSAMSQSHGAFQYYATEDHISSTNNGGAFAWETTTNGTSATTRHRSMTLWGDGKLLLGAAQTSPTTGLNSNDLFSILYTANAATTGVISNFTNGTAALCGWRMQNNNAKGGAFYLTSSGYTANGLLKADSIALYTDGVGGLNLGAFSGSVSLWCGGNTLGTNDILIITTGGATSIRNSLYVGGQVTPTGKLHIAGGTAAANTAPIVVTVGTSETTARSGLIQFSSSSSSGIQAISGNRFTVTESDLVERYILQAISSAKTIGGAPYTNDGYITIVINGTTIKLMTTA